MRDRQFSSVFLLNRHIRTMREKQIAFYKNLELEFLRSRDALHKKHKQISFLRIILFLASAGIAYQAFTTGHQSAGVLTVVIFIFLFGLLVNHHQKTGAKRNHYENLASVNSEEILRLHGILQGFDQGTDYLKEQHPYTYDLDIFGHNSLYQLLNRTETPLGAARLADWLSRPASGREISARQEAVKELADKNAWRQNFQAYGKVKTKKPGNFEFLMQWFQARDHIRNKTVYKWLIRILPSLVLLLLIVIGMDLVGFYSIIPVLIINGLILAKNYSLVRQTHEITSKSMYLLQPYINMVKAIEEASFSHEKLKNLKEELMTRHKPASQQFRSLKRMLSFFDSRSNMLYGILNAFFLIDINLLLLAENWRKQSGKKVPKWLDAVAEMECLNSLSGFTQANTDYVFPEIVFGNKVFETRFLGHPLIAPEKRVNNDFKLKGPGSIAIITGSNMAGKSTFLRTLGVNTVLALAGAPVCAARMTLSPVRLYSSMRTKDNLEENISSFYAELLRIHELLNTAETSGDPVFFLLDELLKGTNSEDRHKGAAALIRQLHEMDTTGLVSTHDLELGKLANEVAGIHNFSFNSYFEGDELIFDYKLNEGLCKSFNASRLMEKMGIRLM